MADSQRTQTQTHNTIQEYIHTWKTIYRGGPGEPQRPQKTPSWCREEALEEVEGLEVPSGEVFSVFLKVEGEGTLTSGWFATAQLRDPKLMPPSQRLDMGSSLY